jgi:LysR family transcriptional activator of glutamate synthase operon
MLNYRIIFQNYRILFHFNNNLGASQTLLWYNLFQKGMNHTVELDLLRSFLAIAKTESFSHAAEELFLSQSALTKQMKRLEKELQATLFERCGRNVCLTAAGRELQKRAPAFLSEYDEIRAAVSPAIRHLRVGVLPIVEYYGIMGKLSAFSQACPKIALELEEAENVFLSAGLEEDHYDMVIMRQTGNTHPGWKYLSLNTDELALVLPAAHPLAKTREVISLANFSNENFIFLSKSTHLYESCVHACRSAGFEPHIFYTGSSAESIVRLVREGAGIAIFMRRVAMACCPEDLAVLRFRETLTTELVLATTQDKLNSPAAKLLWSYLSENY